MTSAAKSWLKRVLIILAAVVLLLFLMQIVPALAGTGIDFTVSLLEILGFVLLFVGLPFLFWIIGGAAYRTLLKPYVRAYHIRQIRNARYLKEAVERGRTEI